MPDSDLTKLLISVARIEERQESQATASEHRHNNLKMTLETLATKAEVASLKEAHAGRLTSLESSRSAVIKWVAGAWLSGVGVVASLILKKL